MYRKSLLLVFTCYHWNYQETNNRMYPKDEKSTRLRSLKLLTRT